MLYESPFLNRTPNLIIALAMFFTSAAIAAADSPSELLQKAIYLEETVGDLDKAIKGYRGVLSATSPSVEAAAEAQYRIGACLTRQGETKKAAKAYQKVVDDYPTAESWVERANEQLSTLNKLLPIPWGDGDEMHLHMKLPGGLDAGYQVFRVAKSDVDGKAYWECQNWQTVTLNNIGGKSRVLADFESFAPIESQWTHSMLGSAAAEFTGGEAAINIVGKDDVKKLKLDGPTYDNEQAAQVFRRLPLADGYEGKIKLVSSLGGALVSMGLKVTAVETIKVPAGSYECFKLELSVVNQTFWISTGEKREIVRFEGGGVEADLVEVRQANAEPKTIGGDRFSLTLPPSWHAYIPGESSESLFLIGPDNSMLTEIESEKTEDAKREFESPEVHLEDFFSRVKKKLKNVSEESEINVTKVGGHRAATIEYEFDGTRSRVFQRRLVVYGNKFMIEMKSTCPAEKLDSQRSKIQQLVERLKLE